MSAREAKKALQKFLREAETEAIGIEDEEDLKRAGVILAALEQEGF